MTTITPLDEGVLFLPRRFRIICFFIVTPFEIGIILTANYAFLNYIMTPQVIADISNVIGYANANAAATPLLDPAVASDPIIFPPHIQLDRMFVQEEDRAQDLRTITRIWQKFKTGE